MLKYIEELAIQNGISKLRLDCDENSEFLNNYYENAGYTFVGKCTEGPYTGNKRKKICEK